MADYTFDQLVDLEQIKQLLESHHQFSGMAYGLFDSVENNLIAVGWQDICVNYHRVHPVTASRCRESDAFIKSHLAEYSGGLLEYRCKNGMIDIAMPILIEGEHLATFFTGQFFYEDAPPEREFFIRQAATLGFDNINYINALDRVPRFSREYIRDQVLFLHHIVQMLAETGLRALLLRRGEEDRRQAELALRKEELKYHRIVDTASEGIWVLGPDSRSNFVNARMCELLGREAPEILGQPISAFMLEEDIPDHWQKMEHRRQGKSEHYERRLLRKDGETIWTLANANPLFDDDDQFLGSFAMFTDITARKQAEEALQRLNRELRAISNCNQTLMRAEDEQALLQEICRIICDEAGYRMAWVGFAEQDEAKSVRPVAWAGVEDGYIAQARLTWADTEQGRSPGGTVIRTGQQVYIQDFTRSPEFAPWLSNALARGYRSGICMPLKDEQGAVFGILMIYSTETNAMTPDELRLLEELAGDLAFGVSVLRSRKEKVRAEKVLQSRLRLLEYAVSHSMDELLTATLDELENLTGSQIGFYHFVEGDGERLSLQGWSTNTLKHMCSAEGKGRHYAVEEAGVWCDCIRERRAVIHNDYASLPHRKGMPEGHAAVIRELIVPIFRQSQIKAVIGVGNKPTEYDQMDVEVVSRLGDLSWDISERKQLEVALREGEQKFRTLAENSSDYIVRYDAYGCVTYANRLLKGILLPQVEKTLGRTPLELFPEGLFLDGRLEMERYQSTLLRVIAEGNVADVEMQAPDGSGGMRIHSARLTAERDENGEILGAVAFWRDVTDRSRLEEQLRQSQKMEAIGQLAGGVAHDFNNILTAITGFGTLVKMKMNPDDPLQTGVDQILAASERAAHLTQGLLAFSRRQVLIPKPIDLNAVLSSVEKLLRRLIGEDIDLSLRLSDRSLIVMADAGQIEQILMNLATNARDAMPRGGTLTLSTEARYLAEDFMAVHGYGVAGRYALIMVTDTGTGMDEATRKRVFEPFFTTKEKGKGTGLGLSIAYGIVKQHEGFINIYSEPGRGTTFRIYLPLIDQSVEEAKPVKAELPPRGVETILLAEDDQDVRMFASSALREFGYHVIEAVDGRDALEKFRTHAQDIKMMILDVIMPRLSGPDVYETIRVERPGMKVLFISGYTADYLHTKGVFEEGTYFLAKPMSPMELLRKIREILEVSP